MGKSDISHHSNKTCFCDLLRLNQHASSIVFRTFDHSQFIPHIPSSNLCDHFFSYSLTADTTRSKGGKAFKGPTTKVSKKVTKSSTGKTKRKKKPVQSFQSYIYAVLKQVHPDTGCSKKTMSIMNSFVWGEFVEVSFTCLVLDSCSFF